MKLLLFLVMIGVTTAESDLKTFNEEENLNAVLKKYCKFTGRCGPHEKDVEAAHITRTMDARADFANQLEELEDDIISRSGIESERGSDNRDIEREYINDLSSKNRDTDKNRNDIDRDKHDVRRQRDKENDYDRRNRESGDRDNDRGDRDRYDDRWDRNVERDFDNDRRNRDNNRKIRERDDQDRMDYRNRYDARISKDNDRPNSDEWGNEDKWGRDSDLQSRGYNRDRYNDYDRMESESRDRDNDRRDRDRYDDQWDRNVERDLDSDRRDRDGNRRIRERDNQDRIDYRNRDDPRNNRHNDRSDSDEWGRDGDRRSRDYDGDRYDDYDGKDRKSRNRDDDRRERNNDRLDRDSYSDRMDIEYARQDHANYNLDGTFDDITRSGNYRPNSQYNNNNLRCDPCDEPEEDDCDGCDKSNLRCGCSIKHDLTRCGRPNKDLRNDKQNNDQVLLQNLLKKINDLVNNKVKSYEGDRKPADKTGQTDFSTYNVDRTINKIFNFKSNYKDTVESLPTKNKKGLRSGRSNSDLRYGCLNNSLRCGCLNNGLRCGCLNNGLRCGGSNNELRCGCSIKHDLTRCGHSNNDLRNDKRDEAQVVLKSLLNNFNDLVDDKVSYEREEKPTDKTDQPIIVSDNDNVKSKGATKSLPPENTDGLRCGCSKNDLRCGCSNHDVRFGCSNHDLRCGCSNNNLRCGCSNHDLRCGCLNHDLRSGSSNHDLRCGCSIKHGNIGRINDDQIYLQDVLKNFSNQVNNNDKKRPVDTTVSTPNEIERTLKQIFNFKSEDKYVDRSYPPKYTNDGKMMLKLKVNKNQHAEIFKPKSRLRFEIELISNLSLDYLINPLVTFKIFEDHNIYLDNLEKDFLKYARSSYSPLQILFSKDIFRNSIAVLFANYFIRNSHIFEQDIEHLKKVPHEHLSNAVNVAAPNPNKKNLNILAYFPVERRAMSNEENAAGQELRQESQPEEISLNSQRQENSQKAQSHKISLKSQPQENSQKSELQENSLNSKPQENSQNSHPSYGFPFEFQLEGLGQVQI